MVLKNFIVLEGIDGSGTSTQINILKEKLAGKNAFFTAEPTDLETGKFLRSILKGNIKLSQQTIAYLFAADRCEHLYGKNGIVERCKNGEIVITDRYLFSSLAYQSVSCGKELPEKLNSEFPMPEYLFYFSIDPKVSLSRVHSRDGNDTEIYENLDYQTKTASLYENVMKDFTDKTNIIAIDASQPIDKVTEKLWTVIGKMPIK